MFIKISQLNKKIKKIIIKKALCETEVLQLEKETHSIWTQT